MVLILINSKEHIQVATIAFILGIAAIQHFLSHPGVFWMVYVLLGFQLRYQIFFRFRNDLTQGIFEKTPMKKYWRLFKYREDVAHYLIPSLNCPKMTP
jgi:hypothetical protein